MMALRTSWRDTYSRIKIDINTATIDRQYDKLSRLLATNTSDDSVTWYFDPTNGVWVFVAFQLGAPMSARHWDVALCTSHFLDDMRDGDNDPTLSEVHLRLYWNAHEEMDKWLPACAFYHLNCGGSGRTVPITFPASISFFSFSFQTFSLSSLFISGYGVFISFFTLLFSLSVFKTNKVSDYTGKNDKKKYFTQVNVWQLNYPQGSSFGSSKSRG